MSTLLDGLNPPQREAVRHGEGPLLVLAGPGSGKTLVLTRRIAYLTEQGIDPERVLAITFTNKAAGEMRERVAALTGRATRWISTFHSFGARILRQFGDRLGYDRDFTIFDEQDSRALVRRCTASLGFDAQSLTPGSVSSSISSWKSARRNPEDALQAAGGLRDRQVAEIFRAYEAELRRQNSMDFDDLLGRLLDLLEREEEVRERLRDRFARVLVDEYQDTNRVQFEIAARLAEEHRNLCVTGDPDQSIYSWRGAEIRNILDFESRFPDARTIRLEQNYRSTRRVLLVASCVIAHNRERKEKDLWSENDDGPPVRVVRCRDASDEAAAIASRVLELYGDGTPYSEMAILYRTNAQSRTIEQALRERGVPFQVLGGVEFFRRREIKDLVAYLRVLVNPQDDVSLERIVNVPPRRIGATTIDRLRAHAFAHGIPMTETIQRHRDVKDLRGVGKSGVARFAALMAKLETHRTASVENALETVIEEAGFLEHLRAEGSRRQEQDRIDNVRELLAAAAEYDLREPEGGVGGFLESVALVSDTDVYDSGAARVTLMTLHSAKGLEFDAVFLTGLEENLLPHQLSVDSPSGVEEERRLFFVGITRSRRDLHLSHARWRGRFGRTSPAVPSRFLEEVPPQAVVASDRDGGLFVDSGSPYDTFDPLVDEDPSRDLRPGATVRHEAFGLGRVIRLRRRAGQARVVVDFGPGGRRELALGFAKLTVVEEPWE